MNGCPCGTGGISTTGIPAPSIQLRNSATCRSSVAIAAFAAGWPCVSKNRISRATIIAVVFHNSQRSCRRDGETPRERMAGDGLLHLLEDLRPPSVERSDGGRSFGFSGLHFHENWQLPEYRRLVTQGVLWTLDLPIPIGGVDVNLGK